MRGGQAALDADPMAALSATAESETGADDGGIKRAVRTKYALPRSSETEMVGVT
jgi:hypothetical protein